MKNYKSFRNKYKPNNIKLIFLYESPPSNGLYFYDKSGTIGEPLFSAMMRLLDFTPQNKGEGLKEFCRRGCFLVDATYTPVNEMNNTKRKETILNDYIKLKKDLLSIDKSKRKPIIIAKCTLHDLLYDYLFEDGFNIINSECIPFPSNRNQNRFYHEMKLLLIINRIDLTRSVELCCK